MDVAPALQVVAVVAFADSGELPLGEREGHVEEQRQVGARQAVMDELQVENPAHQPVALLSGRQFGALEPHVRIDEAVQHDGLARGDPPPDLRSGIGPVAGEEQRHQIGIDLVHAAEPAAQEAGDQLAVNRSVETRKMDVFALHAPLREQPAQQADLGRFTRTVQTFEHDKHNVTLCRFQTIVSQRSIRTARATPSASASASPSVL